MEIEHLGLNILKQNTMETNRDLKELLILLRDYIINQKPENFYGMCAEIDDMYVIDILNDSECAILRYFMDDNRPKGLNRNNYWFPVCEKQPRIDWLNNEISKL